MKRLLVILFVAVCVIFITLGIGMFWVRTQLQAINPQDTQDILVDIPSGTSARGVATLLTHAGLIRNQQLFLLYARYFGSASKIQAGTYQLKKSMDMPTVLEHIQKNNATVTLKILEGWRREEVGAAIAKVVGAQFNWEEYLHLTQNQEGTLFPDTYYLSPDMNTQNIVALLQKQFQKNIAQISLTQPTTQSQSDVLILASLVEREAASDQDKKLVAGVLHNRLKIGMPLQVDASLQYIKAGERCTAHPQECEWWKPPLAADKELDSAYNTYRNAGLPPTPICNPGATSLSAAVNPTTSDYLFYLTDDQGVTHFAKTYDEHLGNIQKYLR